MKKSGLIVALDVADEKTALSLVDRIGDAADVYKIGLELFAAGCGADLTREIKKRGFAVFADLKLHDVPRTTARATARIADLGADFLTVHAEEQAMQAAVENRGETKILAVTVLTSLAAADLRAAGFAESDPQKLALARARRARAVGCAGVIAAGEEARELRRELGADFLLVTPGIRPSQAAAEDQKRVSTPAAAVAAGADYIVVGRPIHAAADPRQAALAIKEEIANPASREKCVEIAAAT